MGRAALVMKPAWSPHYLQGCDYLGRLTAYRTSLVRGSGGLRDVPEVAREWDLALRATALARGVSHLRRVVYHGLRPPPSALGTSLPRPTPRPSKTCWASTWPAPIRLRRRSRSPGPRGSASVGGSRTGRRSASCSPPLGPGCPVVRMRIRDCLDDLFDHTEQGPLDVCVVISGNARDGVDRALRGVRRPAPLPAAARRVQLFAEHQRGRSCGLRRAPAAAERRHPRAEPSWLRRMAERALDPWVGVVGGSLLFPDGRIQHVGVMHDEVGALPLRVRGRRRSRVSGRRRARHRVPRRNWCLPPRAARAFRACGRLRHGETEVNYNDIDFCLKVVRGLGFSLPSRSTPRCWFTRSPRRGSLVPFTRWRVPDSVSGGTSAATRTSACASTCRLHRTYRLPDGYPRCWVGEH